MMSTMGHIWKGTANLGDSSIKVHSLLQALETTAYAAMIVKHPSKHPNHHRNFIFHLISRVGPDRLCRSSVGDQRPQVSGESHHRVFYPRREAREEKRARDIKISMWLLFTDRSLLKLSTVSLFPPLQSLWPGFRRPRGGGIPFRNILAKNSLPNLLHSNKTKWKKGEKSCLIYK